MDVNPFTGGGAGRLSGDPTIKWSAISVVVVANAKMAKCPPIGKKWHYTQDYFFYIILFKKLLQGKYGS